MGRRSMQKITAIIPTYNRSYLLKKAIQSVLRQTYEDFILIILDNHSEDNTREVVKEFQKSDYRITYICHDQNLGMMKNYEYGFSLIKTPYFHFLSDDDLILADFYKEAVQVFEKHPDIGFYGASTEIISNRNQVIDIPNHLWSREGYFPKTAATCEMIGRYPVPTTILFSSMVLQDVTPDYHNKLRWDCDFLVQISIKYPIFISKRRAGIFLSHEQSYSRKPEITEVIEAIERMQNRIYHATDLNESKQEQIISNLKKEFIRTFRSSLLDLLMRNEILQLKRSFSELRGIYNVNYPFYLVLFLYRCAKAFPYTVQILRLFRKMKNELKLRK
jgi:glycosyltransferase involved in cell wall biosynthesis